MIISDNMQSMLCTIIVMVFSALVLSGTYVDRRIMPGFCYRVRKLDSGITLFDDRALQLMNIGRGYGKRITFKGEMLNSNPNYFYSDTHDAGYGFQLASMEDGDMFTVSDIDSHMVGEVTIGKVHSQQEINTDIKSDRSVVKKLMVTFTCSISYWQHHGLMSLYCHEELQLSGLAIVQHKKGCQAVTKYIEEIELPHHGLVTFIA